MRRFERHELHCNCRHFPDAISLPAVAGRNTDRLLGAFAIEDEIRPESSEAVAELHRLGIRVAMITGDSKTVADSVARRIGIDEVAAEVLPADKASAVTRFQRRGKVAMVGDGVNEAPALATATVGIARGAGTDVAIESAGIVLVRSDPRDVVGAIELSRATYRKMIQNLVWATGYNLIAIPIACRSPKLRKALNLARDNVTGHLRILFISTTF